MGSEYILAIDEGTTSVRAVLYSVKDRKIVGLASHDITQRYPVAGYVEHDGEEIWNNTLMVMRDVILSHEILPTEIASIAITNQRESIVCWDRFTGKPAYNVLVWQCKRTTEYCHELANQGLESIIKDKTGLVLDPYFSASKLRWLLQNSDEVKRLYAKGALCVGTIESYLTFRLTEGRSHVSDVANGSRTMLMDIDKNIWDDELCALFGVDKQILPRLVANDEIVGYTTLLGGKIDICGLIGDQQSSLFGEACFAKGMAKNTYGTGCFILINTGNERKKSDRLLSTTAWKVGNSTTYALEGSIFNGGSVVQWLRDELGVIKTSSESETLATAVPDSGGVYFVPAFSGLGTPYWEAEARGAIVGLTRGSNRNHIVRAGLESIAYSTLDIIEYMKNSGIYLAEMRCDGGASKNNFLMQFQADMLRVPLKRAKETETTALGAIYLSGLGKDLWDMSSLGDCWEYDRVFTPEMKMVERATKYYGWLSAVNMLR